jgi:hypothetical protein
MMSALASRPKASDLVFRLYTHPVPVLHDADAAIRILEWKRATLSIRMTDSGHIINWHRDRAHFTEIITTLDSFLPDNPRLSHVFQGERRGRVEHGGVRYEMGLQLERLPHDLFAHIHDDLVRSEPRGFLHRFEPHHRIGLEPLAFASVEFMARGVTWNTFHTFPNELTLVKTQALLEFADG